MQDEGSAHAAGYFEQALALDPTALRAAESLALVHVYIAEWGYAPPREGFERARISCERVLKLHPTSGMAYAQLALMHSIHDWNWDAAVRPDFAAPYRKVSPMEESERVAAAPF